MNRIIPPLSRKQVELFWAKVDKTPGQGPQGTCWTWTGALSEGYGSFGWSGAGTFGAHRIAYFLEHGGQPGPVCCHSCDNPPCVNPADLVSADQAFNVADRDAKGRGGGDLRRGKNNGRHTMPESTCRGKAWHKARPPKVLKKVSASLKRYYGEHPELRQGANNANAKLTEADVREIRRAYSAGEASSLKLAARFGVSKPVVLSLIHRRSWAHVT